MHSYIIKPGDSFYLIAQQLGISVQELKALNNYAGDLLYPNQKINIPDLSLPPGLYGPRSSGRPVREIQLALSAIGYALDIDGIFGAKTEEIIYQIQKKISGNSPGWYLWSGNQACFGTYVGDRVSTKPPEKTLLYLPYRPTALMTGRRKFLPATTGVLPL